MQNEGIIDRVAGSGSYVRLREARREGLTFGLLVPDLGQVEVLGAICQGMAEAPESDHALLWPHAERNEDRREERALELCLQLIRRKVNGVFFAPFEFELSAEKTNRQIVRMLQEADVPVVLLDRRVGQRAERTRLDMVGINNWQVGYLATEHLIKQGLKSIAFLGYHAAQATIAGRMSGYARCSARLRSARAGNGGREPRQEIAGGFCLCERLHCGAIDHEALWARARVFPGTSE